MASGSLSLMMTAISDASTMVVLTAEGLMPAIRANSPVDFQFQRQGGADIQAEVQIWPKKANYSPTDRPVHRVRFGSPLMAHEAESVNIANGFYTCVFVALVREALNGVFALSLVVEGKQAYSTNGDVNTSSKPGDLKNLRAAFDLEVV